MIFKRSHPLGFFSFFQLFSLFLFFDLHATEASDLSGILPFSIYAEQTLPPTFAFQLDLGLTYDFVSAMKALMNSQGSPILLKNALENRYGSNQETFSRIKFGYYHFPLFDDVDIFKHGYVELIGEFGFWGVSNNPVLSELHGKIAWTGIVSAGFTGHLPTLPVGTKIGFVGGRGLGRKIDVISPDLTVASPPENEDLQLYGIDLGLWTSTMDEGQNVLLGTSLDYKGTVFFSSLDGKNYSNRWKSFSYFESLVLTRSIGIKVRPHLILSQQPLPFEIFPRTWDYIHQENVPNSIPYWTGLGADLILNRKSDLGLKGTFGIYGRHFGASIMCELPFLFLRFGSWGFNIGPDYPSDSERLWQASLGFQF